MARRRNRHYALYLAFETLDETKSGKLPRELVTYVLQRMRPSYSEAKIEVRLPTLQFMHGLAPEVDPSKCSRDEGATSGVEAMQENGSPSDCATKCVLPSVPPLSTACRR